METKENNKRLLIVVGVLLLVVGVSLAYFVSNILINGKGANTKITTAVIKGATLNIEGILEFEDLEILPGHKTASGIKVTATGNNELIPYNLIWNGTNTLTTPLEFKIYKTSEEIEVNATCEKKRKAVGSVTQISEECSITNIDKLGTEIASGRINKNDTKVILAKDEFITATSTGDVKYYYVILEYPNLNEAQNYDLEGSLEGKVTVEESNIKPDINILAIQIEQEDGSYQEVEEIPQSGYILDVEKSVCSNGVKISNIDDVITLNNLTKSGTSCHLYFNHIATKNIQTALGTLRVNTYSPSSFSNTSYTNDGLYETEDEMGKSYYYRGAVTNNYLKFADKWWRIVRINGDGTIRIIYNGTNAKDSIIKKSPFNLKNYNNAYVGLMYGDSEANSYSEAHSNTNKSTILTELETWYETNLMNYADKIDGNAGFCGDRSVNTGSSAWAPWDTKKGYGKNATAYGIFNRTRSTSDIYWNLIQTPTLKCKNNNDWYTTSQSLNGNKSLTYPIGLISADEVIFAGGMGGRNNARYYLCNEENYWTMTPYISTLSVDGSAIVLRVGIDGDLDYNFGYVSNSSFGIRPVINLKADVTVIGNGTIDNPYIVQ